MPSRLAIITGSILGGLAGAGLALATDQSLLGFTLIGVVAGTAIALALVLRR